MLRSRLAPWIARGLPVVAVAFAALPDAGVEWGFDPWVFILILVILVIAQEAVRTLVHGNELGSYSATFESIGGIISSLAGSRRGAGHPQIFQEPNVAVDTLLRRARDLVKESLKLPAGHQITANLLLPESGSKGVIGLRATRADDFYPDRQHEIIPLDTPGAAVAFSSGKPAAVPYTEAETHQRVRGRAYKSIGAFPIMIGDASDRVVIGVLSLDSTMAYTFSWSTVRKLNPFVSPIAQLIGLALELRDERSVS
jgi:hypothetical protein